MSMLRESASLAWHLLINLTVLGSVLALSLTVVFRLTRAAAPRARYLLAATTFFVAALLPIAMTFDSARAGAELKTAPMTKRAAAEASNFQRADSALVAPTQTPRELLRRASSAVATRINSAVRLIEDGPLGLGLLTLWVAIAALLFGRELAGHLLLRQARGQWRPATEELRRELAWPAAVPLQVDEHEGPLTVGLCRPAVVLPAYIFTELPVETARRIARHELAHATWRDPLINAVVRAVRAALWPSAPLWLLECLVRAEREASADRAAIGSATSAQEFITVAADYAASLVAIAQRVSASRAAGLIATESSSAAGMEARIRRLFDSPTRLTRARLTLAGAVFLCGLLSTAFLPVASYSFAQHDEQQAVAIGGHTPGALAQPSVGSEQAAAALHRLLAALKDRDWQVAGEVAAALEQIKRSGTVEPLVVALRDGDWRTREKVAWALGQLGARQAVEPLLVAWQNEQTDARNTMAWALGMIGDSRAISPLLPTLADSSPETRRAAAWALGRIGDQRAVTPLIAALQDESSTVRHAAAWALGMIGDRRAIAPLRAALKDENRLVRDKAAWALDQIARR